MGPRLDSRGRGIDGNDSWRIRLASMGPRLDSRGRSAAPDSKRERLYLLQWGRGWTAAEGPLTDAAPGGWERLQWGRGWTAAEGACLGHVLLVVLVLQWGRGWTAAEGPGPAAGGRPPRRLQWGRGWTAAEGR